MPEPKKSEELNESLEKSMDSLIDELFTEQTPSDDETPENTEEKVEKAAPVYEGGKPSSLMKQGSDAGPSKETADEGETPKKSKKEEEDERGRPKEVQDVPETDKDGSRAKGYDHIQKPNSSTPATSPKGTVVKSYEISPEDYGLLQKAKEDQKEEALQKAKEEQKSLMKSAILEATSEMKSENAELKKSLEETKSLVKAIAEKPQARKSIENIQALEKSLQTEDNPSKPRQEAFSKSEMMDVAEDLVEAKKITLEQAIELDDTGCIYNPQARAIVEAELKKRS